MPDMSTDRNDEEEVLVRPPAHPVAALQGPFEESMIESVNDLSDYEVPLDALTRRTMLLDARKYQRVISGRWKQKPGEKYHPLWKLVAQMSFGMHLLARNLAKSEDEVMKILQVHVDDIDGFLERTTEDFDLAQTDMHERLQCLKLPLAHSDVFDRMLEDRTFRASILDGNEKIEHIMNRTRKLMRDSLKDVQKGFDATNVLDKYLNTLTSTWERKTLEHEAVFVAMLGNVEGWRKAFMQLHLQGNQVSGILSKLAEVVAEMARRAAVVSRKLLAKSQVMVHPLSQSTTASAQERSASRASQVQKPLPLAPSQERLLRKKSSRADPKLATSSRPDSGRNSSHGRSSGSPSQSRDSHESRSSKRTPNTPGTAAYLGSKTTSPETAQYKPSSQLSKLESHVQQDGNPIELPADVPEDVMRQAPVSNQNRLSMTLGFKPRDNSDHRISSVYYPRALGDLLKVSSSPHLLMTPSGGNRGLAVRSASPHTDSDTDYFSAHEQSPSVGVIVSENKPLTESGKTSPEESARDASIQSPRVRASSSPHSPREAFTSHPSVMEMASPPTELPAAFADDDETNPRSREESESSLGEPGPEISEADLEDEGTEESNPDISPPAQHSLSPTTQSPGFEQGKSVTAGAADGIRPPEHPTTIHAEENSLEMKEVVLPMSKGEPLEEASLVSTGEANSEQQPKLAGPSEQVESHEAEPLTTPEGTPEHEGSEPVYPIEREMTPLPPQTEEPVSLPAIQGGKGQKSFAAELEAFVPSGKSPKTPTSPIELEAPQQHFVLPSRASGVPTPVEAPRDTRAAIRQRAEMFKLAAKQTINPGWKPKDFGKNAGSDPEPIKPLNLRLERKDGRLVPVQVTADSIPTTDPMRPQSQSADIITNLIDQISSSTPGGSPIHQRAASAASSNSARIHSARSSRSFAPPETAPAPPAPGGRPMATPDYAAIGQFDGERRQPKRSSEGSKSGWRDLLSSAASRRNSSDSSSKSLGHSAAGLPSSNRGSVSDMLTAAGKDVLWFKGEGKKPVQAVSG